MKAFLKMIRKVDCISQQDGGELQDYDLQVGEMTICHSIAYFFSHFHLRSLSVVSYHPLFDISNTEHFLCWYLYDEDKH
jgi:hypothetical protein